MPRGARREAGPAAAPGRRITTVKQAIAWRLTAVLLSAGLSLLYLLPSLVGPQRLPSWWRYVRPFLVAPPPEPINLGLDLQGGMHLVLEVDAPQAVANTVLRLAAELRRAGWRLEGSHARQKCAACHKAAFRDLIEGHVDLLFANQNELLALTETRTVEAATCTDGISRSSAIACARNCGSV